MYAEESSIPTKLRALWTLFSIGKLDEQFLAKQLDHSHESIRGWSIRLLCEDKNPSGAVLERFAQIANDDASPYVRLQLAGMLQRLKHGDRPKIAAGLLTHAEDIDDQNIPLMIWFGVEPLVADGIPQFVALAQASRLPLVSQFMARRVAAMSDRPDGLVELIKGMNHAKDDITSALLLGTLDGLAGRRSVPMPANWNSAFASLQQRKDDAVRDRAIQLALVFDDANAFQQLVDVMQSTSASTEARNRAIDALVSKHWDRLPPYLMNLVADPATRRSAIRGLAEFDKQETVNRLLEVYVKSDAPTRQDILQTLSSRVSWATELLNAIESGKIPRSDLTAYTARQIQSLKNQSLTARIKAVWGEMRVSSSEKVKLIASYKDKLSNGALDHADRSAGRALFQKTCANCHRFFGSGGQIGPDITGSQRSNLDYLLQTVVDPSAAVARDYQMQIIELTSGRIVTGLIVGETTDSLTIQSINERIVIPKPEIESRTSSSQSMMPEGMLQPMSIEQIRDLFGYLMGPEQVPLPAGSAAARE
jgi:putative heme-binding domain-containing protein